MFLKLLNILGYIALGAGAGLAWAGIACDASAYSFIFVVAGYLFTLLDYQSWE